MLAAVLSIAMLMTFAGAALDGFHDAPSEDNWKFYGLDCAVRDGVMNGHNGALRPDDPITRAELTTMMVRFLGADAFKADVSKYVDLAADAWYYEYIRSGVAVKIINGSGNKMMPNDPVTREQAIAILARTFVLLANNENALNSFSDTSAVSSWAKSDTSALIERKVVLGGSNNDIRPKSNVTRAEFAAMLYRIVFVYAKGDVNYAGKTIEGSLALTDANIDLTGAVINGDLYIVEAVGDATITLKDVTVKGDIIVRSGNVVIEGNSNITNIIYGNATGSASVTGKDGVEADKIVITDSAKDVDNNISAGKVEVNTDNADINLGGDTNYGNVTINGSNTDVNVEQGSVVNNATINGEGSTITGSGTINNVTDNTQKPDDGEGDEQKPGSSIAGGGGAGGGGTTPPAGFEIDAAGTYISWNENGSQTKYVYATLNGNVVTFDLSEISVPAANAKLLNLYIKANKSETGSIKGFSGASITTNTEKLLSTLLVEMLNSTSKSVSQILGITDATGSVKLDSNLANLANVVNTAYLAYTNDMSADKWMQDLFDARYITVASEKSFSFVGKIDGKEYTIKFLLP